jgi:hypothetical protein
MWLKARGRLGERRSVGPMGAPRSALSVRSRQAIEGCCYSVRRSVAPAPYRHFGGAALLAYWDARRAW